MIAKFIPFRSDNIISNMYRQIGINKPDDINIYDIAKEMNIYLTFSNLRHYCAVDGDFKIININNRIEGNEREVFFHELHHAVFDVGCQTKMPKMYVELQERRANIFVKYAAIPLHMLQYIDFKSDYVVQETAELFAVSEEIATYRIEQIKRNVMGW